MQHPNQQTLSLNNATRSHLRLRDSHDAHILFQAVRQGHLPLIRRRLTRPEQKALHAGQVFVWTDREGSLEGWTDGHAWGSARVREPFLVYDEVFEDTDAFLRRKAQQNAGERSVKQRRGKTLSPLPGGLSKQTYSATFIQNGVDIQDWHLTAYFRDDSETDNLITPDEDRLLRTIFVPEGTFKSSMSHKSKGSSCAHRSFVSKHQSNGSASGDSQEIGMSESLIDEHIPLVMFSSPPLQTGIGLLVLGKPLAWEASFHAPTQRLRTSPSRGLFEDYQLEGRAPLAHPPQPPCHDSEQHGIDDDDDLFEQLNRAISKYEPLRHYPSLPPSANSTCNEIGGSPQVNKSPPFPSRSDLDPSFRPLHELHSQAIGFDSPPWNASSLSIGPPPSSESRVSASSRNETFCTSMLGLDFGTATNSFLSYAAFTPSLYGPPSGTEHAQILADPAEQSWSDPEVELTNWRECSLSETPIPSVTHPPQEFRISQSPGYPSHSTATKRKRAAGHIQSPLPDLISLPQDSRDYRRNRINHQHHKLSGTSSSASTGEALSSMPSQVKFDGGTLFDLSSAVEWVYTLPLTLEELFKGVTYTYRVTTQLRSGEPKLQDVQIDVKPGWKTGTRVSFPNAGNERYPGVFQTMTFVVRQVIHERFTRREGGKLECDQDISPLEARMANGKRTLRKVVGLDGKVIEFYPPEGVIHHGQETVLRGEGMPQRSRGEVVGRGDLIIRWNINRGI